MITDKLKNLRLYAALNLRFAKVAEWLDNNDIAALPEGRYDIYGEEAFITISENELRPPEAAFVEAHDRYVDIQAVIRGTEGYGWIPRGDCAAVKEEYDAARDLIFYSDRPHSIFNAGPGDMLIFFPRDGHAPLLGTGTVRKAVIKVSAE